MAVTANVNVSITGQHTQVLDLGVAAFPFALSQIVALVSGIVAGAVDKIFSDTRTLIASATEDLDLAGGVLLDAYGQGITMVKLKAVAVKGNAANTNNVNFGRAAANGVPLMTAVSSAIPVKPGGFLLWIAPDLAGIAVTAGTGDLLTFTNSAAGTPVTYDVIILGTSA